MENNINEQKKVVDYWATNKPESTTDYYAAQFQQIWNNNYRRFLESTRFFTGWMTNEESLNSLNEDIEKARQRQLQTEQRMAEYKATESGAKNLVLDVTGGLVQAFGDPINFVINKATPAGILFDIAENALEYAWDMKSLYGRNIFTDFKKEDVVNLGASAVMTGTFSKINNKVPQIDGVPLYKETGKRLSPLDNAIQNSESLSEDIKQDLKAKGFDTVVNMSDIAETVKRQEYDQPQGNYTKDIIKENISSYLDEVDKINKVYQKDLATSKRSSLDVKEEATIAIKPLKNNIELNIRQIEAEDTRELFGENASASKFGNQAYDMLKDIDKKAFASRIQGKGTFSDPELDRVAGVIKDRINQYVALKSGEVSANDIEYAYYSDVLYNKQEYMQYLRGLYENQDYEGIKVLGQYIGKEVELTKQQALAVGLPFDENKINRTARKNAGGFSDFYNELNVLKNKFKKEKNFYKIFNNITPENYIDRIQEIKKRLNKNKWLYKEVDKLEMLAKSRGKIEETNTYSIDSYPLEITKAFYYDVNSTTREAMKGNSPLEYKNKYHIGDKWGNKNENFKNFDNYMKSMEGFENEAYEVTTNVFSQVAKEKSGLNLLETLLDDTKLDAEEFTDNVTLKQKYILTGLERNNVRPYILKQLNGILENNSLYGRYKPNLWVDPKQQRLNSGMAKASLKNFFSWKLLGNLNFIREFPTNQLRVALGARKLGWNKKYSIFQSSILDPIKINSQLAKNARNIWNGTVEQISDPIIKRRMELFIERRAANDPIWNNPETFGIGYKLNKKFQQGVHQAGKIGATGQLISDVHRIANAEWASINYLKDIFPDIDGETITKNPLLKRVLNSNAIDSNTFKEITNRIKSLKDEELMELVWSGKRADNATDYKIQSLFEQFSDIMGREFNAFERTEVSFAAQKVPFVVDMMMLYKRYSLGAMDNFARGIMSYYADDGMIRKRFDYNGDFKANWKQTFKGINGTNFIDMGKAAIGTSLLYTGVKWVHGNISGSSEDELAEAKLKAIFGEGDVLPFVMDSVQNYALDMTGIGIVYGGSSVWGSLQNTSISRWKRAFSAERISTEEALTWWLTATFLTPEFISRGIDTIKFEKNLPTRLTTSSKTEQRLWKYKYRRLAEIEQIKGDLPFQKAFSAPINWLSYFKNNVDDAYAITGSDKSMDKDVVIAGAYGITSMAEEFSEIASLEEILSDERQEYKDTQLKILGLDVKTQMERLTDGERATLETIMAYRGTSDEREILLMLQQLNRSDDKKAFLKSLIEPQLVQNYMAFQKEYLKNRDKIKKEIAEIKTTNSLEKLILTLEIIRKYSY